ncbi:MAG: dTDP-4-dehydrorhamnose reductase [Oscillospiraceae bacterium]|nr:dTDP-4-dehydrorhamnose reductase [Oscillospiraceae bacterium]
MKVFVTGASGQLGHDVCRELKARGIEHRGVSSRELDITDGAAAERMLRDYCPDAVIHCAAYTAVDRAEDEAARCWQVNAAGTANLAAVCAALGSKLLYVSTDYVFSGEGERPWETEDAVAPRSVYGRTKLTGELAVRSMVEKYFIVRISWVFGANGGNFVKTMLRLAESREEVSVVADQLGSPTYTADLAPLLCDMIETERYGVYHAANEGVCSWADFAAAVFRLAGKSTRVRPITTAEYPAKASRPLNSRLSRAALDEAGFARLPAWEDALERYLREISVI